jgi:hypothetical protein
MGNVAPPDVPMAGEGFEAWADATVTFTAQRPEAMPAELAAYLELGSHIADWLPDGAYVQLSVEPDWDGCGGRWLNLDLRAQDDWIASVCAVDAFGSRATADAVQRTLAILDAGGWDLHVDGDTEEPWGYWEVRLPTGPTTAAAMALQPALSLFDILEPARWFVSMHLVPGYDDVGTPTTPAVAEGPSSVDLRAWRRSVGLAAPPPTIAPRDSEAWAAFCEAGLHELHAPPCWDGR